MKWTYLKPLLALPLLCFVYSCEKDAARLDTLSDVKVQALAEKVYPLDENEISTSILPKRPLPRAVLRKFEYYETNKVKIIDTICDDYIQGTTKLDLSDLKEGEQIRRIAKGDFFITADPEFRSDGFIKLANGPAGWWTHWNYSPYTESEYPTVLYAQNEFGREIGYIYISFNKPVTTFGFEIAPNTLGTDIEVSVDYYDSPTYRSPTMYRLTQTISSPSGARLIAVKSRMPFIFLRISLRAPDFKLSGFAISNIRYSTTF